MKRLIVLLVSVIILSTMLAVVEIPYTVKAAPDGWDIVTIDSKGQVGWFSSIALDSEGNVHVSYYNYSFSDLKYATNADGSWKNYTLDIENDVGRYSSIALDSQDNVHISYYDNTNGDLKHMTNAGGIWSMETVVSAGNVGQYSCIRVDAEDNLHILYWDYGVQSLNYIIKSSGTWGSPIIVKSLSNGCGSLAIDSNSGAHIVCTDLINNQLEYITNSGGSWTNETVCNGGGYYPSIALDNEENVHICFTDGNYDLHYATNTGGSWELISLDSIGHVGLVGSIALDANDKVYISYTNAWDGGDLRFLTNAGGDWSDPIIVDEVNNFTESAITVDSKGYVHICYYDFRNADLVYAVNEIAIPPGIPQNLDAVGEGRSVTLTWSAPEHSGSADITGYNIYRGESSGELSHIATVTGMSFLDTNVTDCDYQYKVSAVSEDGESALTGAVSITLGGQDMTFIIIIIAIVAVVIIAIVGVVMLYLRKKK